MKKKILVSYYNTHQVGGPNVSSDNIINSYLGEKYSFSKIIINEHLGKVLRIKTLRRLIREIKEANPDLILIGGLQLHGFYLMLASKLAGYKKRTFVIVHGSACDAIHIGKFSKFLFGKIIEPFIVRNAACLTTVCKQMSENKIVKNNVKNFGGVIHNPIPQIDYPKRQNQQFAILKSSILNDTRVKLIYTGRIVQDKGLDYLLEAMLSLDAALYLAGDGPDIEKYKQMTINLGITDKVVFLGKVYGVVNILDLFDIFVFPSLHENLPNSILEACFSGLPVVATDVGGIPEIIQDGFNGLLVIPRSSKCLANAIAKLISNKQERLKMGNNAKEFVIKNFSNSIIIPKYEFLFDSLIQKNIVKNK